MVKPGEEIAGKPRRPLDLALRSQPPRVPVVHRVAGGIGIKIKTAGVADGVGSGEAADARRVEAITEIDIARGRVVELRAIADAGCVSGCRESGGSAAARCPAGRTAARNQLPVESIKPKASIESTSIIFSQEFLRLNPDCGTFELSLAV